MTDFGEKVSLHSTSHEDAGDDEVDFSGIDGRVNYVDRGDLSFWDFVSLNFTLDGNWNELDLSSILPKGDILVRFKLSITDNAINSLMEFRKNGNSNEINIASSRTQVADITCETDLSVMCDSDGIIEYRATNTSWSSIGLAVLGWYP